MESTFFLNFLSEIAYFLIVFGVLFMFAIVWGRQAIINIIVGLYLALLISVEFPYYDQVLGSVNGAVSVSVAKLSFFLFLTLLSTILCFRIMPDAFREMKLESLSKKFIHALCATILIMVFSFNVLPVTEFLTPGTPLQTLFAPQEYFFWWLILPLFFLFVL